MGKRKRQQNDDTLDDPFEYSPNNEKSLKHDPVEIEPVFFKQTPTTSISIEKIPSLKSHGLLHILTYNIFGWKKNKTFGNNFSRVVKLLRESDADIIGLQEVIRNDKLEKLAKELNMDYIFAPAMSSDFGNALLTRFPIAKYSVHELKVGSHEIRSLICAQIKVANILLHVNVTHLDVESESTRLVQLKKIFDFVGSQPHLLVGDFNSLRKQDYTNEQWELITKVRKDNAIELPFLLWRNRVIQIVGVKLLGIQKYYQHVGLIQE